MLLSPSANSNVPSFVQEELGAAVSGFCAIRRLAKINASLAESGVNSRKASYMVGESDSLGLQVLPATTGAGRNPSPDMW